MPSIDFRGKRHIYAHHLTVPYRPLVLAPDRSEGDCPDDDNLIIHGDNLHALKALMPRFAGRVKCIYIDPPYNTGNEGWAYNDNANGPILKQWLADEGPVDGEDLERHDKWLCMMWPRLHLLKELLSEDGVIFVSIDDNEQHHLRMLMDEIFGEENFIANIIWQKKYSPSNDAKHLSDNHDFVICYARSIENYEVIPLPRTSEQDSRYKNLDNDPRGPWKSSGLDVKTYSPDNDYEIETPSGRIVNPPVGKCWRYSRHKFNELAADNRIWFGKSGNNVPSTKRFLSEVKQGVTPLTVWTYKDVGHTQSGTQMLNDIGLAFDNPKPTTLLERMIHIAADPRAIVLDSFAGSGTTAQAVLALNKQDGGNRRFILVECEDYADSITAERVRRVISGVPDATDTDLREGLDGSFTYCTLGDPITADGMLNGETLPEFSTLAAWLMHTSTGRSLGPSELQPLDENGLIHSDSRRNYYLLYKPDLDWLRSNEAVLNETRAEEIAAICSKQQKEAVVFAAGKYIELDDLSELKIMFGQLPFEISRAEQV